MKHISLFSGIGGFSLACGWLGIETILHCEIDSFCQKVLLKHYLDVPIVKDVNNVEEIKAITDAYRERQQQPQGGIENIGGRTLDRNQGVVRNPESNSGNSFRGISQGQNAITRRGNPDDEQRTIAYTESRESRKPTKSEGREDSSRGDSENGASSDSRCQRPQERQEQTAGVEQHSQQVTPDTAEQGLEGRSSKRQRTRQGEGVRLADTDSLLLTAGFPCQPFSNAGRRRGASDNRYLWPHTLAVIKSVKPDRIILENVLGITNMVFPGSIPEMAIKAVQAISDFNLWGWTDFPKTRKIQIPFTHIQQRILGRIVNDLEDAGYDFPRTKTGEPIVLCVPACGIGAPHQRYRIWVTAYSTGSGAGGIDREASDERGRTSEDRGKGIRQTNRQVGTSGVDSADRNVSHSIRSGQSGDTRRGSGQESTDRLLESESRIIAHPDRSERGTSGIGQTEGEVNGQLPQSESGRQDSIPTNPDNTTSTRQRGIGGQVSGEPEPEGFNNNNRVRPDWQENWYEVATRFCRVDDGLPRVLDRVERLKSLGNAIVPEVAFQVLKSMLDTEER